MRTIILYLFLLVSAVIKAQNENCENKKINFTTKGFSKNVYFFFRKTHVKKFKRIYVVSDETGKILIKCKMKSKQNGDQYFIKEFRRILIINNQIHEVKFRYDNEFGLLKIYNKCGELIETKRLKSEELNEEYNFNSKPLLQ